MRRKTGWAASSFLVLFVILLLLVNVFVLARVIEVFPFTANIGTVASIREGAAILAEYYEAEAKRLGLTNNQAVRDALATFKFEIDHSVNKNEVAMAINRHGRQVQDVINREGEELDRRLIWEMVKGEPSVKSFQGKATIVFKPGPNGVTVQDEAGLLSPEAEDRIRKAALENELTSIVQIDVVDGNASLLTTRSATGQLDTLRKEVEALRNQLQSSMQTGGFAELTGRGLILRATLKPEVEAAETMFGYDVRDIVNELFAAGARGIEIGGQRLVATTSIRSVGDILLVNHKPVQTSPVVIKAVGEPEVLESSLDLLVNTPYFTLDVSVSRENTVLLKAFSR